ncbi:tripartite tricarboxylate transporter substrate binding protein [Polaromonas sp.]|uniref:Bug family tripartite tricarboxylate transporter substrate binding protein n=1 Tax=Polaromonas sp. TaxID=1869339 RepID=UPI00286B71D0|nr:tripartite tricarboxylate transporter substrate binding protein [Polaromonas sp.]
MKRRILLQAAPALLCAPRLARAQAAYPARPIRYIVPVVPGGGGDMVARTLAECWAGLLGQPLVVDNMGGGGGVLGCQAAVRAAPDGYTLMQAYVTTHGTGPAARRVPYDPIHDFSPIGMIGTTPNVLVVNKELPVTTLREFIAYLRENQGRASYGSAGQGSLTHLSMELFKQQTGTFMLHIPYRGAAPAFVDLAAGHTQAMFPGLVAGLPHIQSGRLRPLAITGLARHPLLQDLPTLEESGFKGFDAQQWYGVVGPAGLPAPIIRKINESLAAVLALPELREKFSSEAIEPVAMSPDQFGAYIKTGLARWSRLVRERRLTLDG